MSRRKVWLVVTGIALLVIIIGVVVLAHWMSGSSTGDVHIGTPVPNAPAAPTQTLAIKNSYFATDLPAGFSLKRQTETPTSDPLLQLMAATPSTIDEQFTASYSQTPPGGITSAGDYNLRASQTGTYARFTPKDLPAGATAFQTVSGPASLVVFWPHGSHYVELSVSTDGTASPDKLQAVFSHVMSSWQWQQ
jgi:hypothetical protein